MSVMNPAGARVEPLDPRAEAVLMTLLDAVECGVLLFGSQGELWAANDRVCEILRTEPAGLREFANFDAVVAALAQKFANSEAVAARWRERRKNGQASWDELELRRPEQKVIERFARPVFDRHGQQLGWLEVYRDITGQRLIESRMFHTERVAALGQLASGIAHELNNPLTSILGYAQLLLRRTAGSERDADAGRILKEAERASRIAKNLLLFARETKLERTLVNLNEIVERTLELRSYQLRLENIQVELNLEPRLPPTQADAAQLQQVLLNLMVNAEQAIQQGGGKGHIWLSTRLYSSDRVAFEVADDGPGIPPEIVPRIFDPFFTTKPPGVGTGLGLSILYSIVHQHGGAISVEDRPGGGMTFTVAFPIAAGVLTEELQPQAISSDAREGQEGQDMRMERRRQRILVVEDEPTVACLIADVLGEEGHPVDRVLDSRVGIEMIRRHTYALVVCDLRMPHLDGRGFSGSWYGREPTATSAGFRYRRHAGSPHS